MQTEHRLRRNTTDRMDYFCRKHGNGVYSVELRYSTIAVEPMEALSVINHRYGTSFTTFTEVKFSMPEGGLVFKAE